MANIDLAAQAMSRAGLAATYNGGLTAVDTYRVANDGRTFLHFKKTGANPCNVTIVTFAGPDGLASPNRVVVVPANNGDVMVGRFPREVYNDPATGKLQFTLSEVTGLTVAVVQLPNN